jgi:hypothetical protein
MTFKNKILCYFRSDKTPCGTQETSDILTSVVVNRKYKEPDPQERSPYPQPVNHYKAKESIGQIGSKPNCISKHKEDDP